MRWFVPVALVLSFADAFAQGRGVPQNGYPDWAERMVLVYTNRSRTDPVTDLANCTVCAEKACYSQPLVPVIYNHGISRAARFHSANLRLTGCFAHHSPCALVSDISTRWETTCDGAAACACQGGTFTCTSSSSPCAGCTGTFARIGLFAPGGSGENIAFGYPTPRGVHYAWFHEPDTDSTCGFRTANGHRANMMSDHKSLGVGRSLTHYTQNFGNTGAPTGTLIAGGHDVGVNGVGTLSAGTNSVNFMVNYYDTRGAPLAAQVNVDGLCQNMPLERGGPTNATYATAMSLPGAACRRYIFAFKDPAGTIVLLPQSGSYGVGGAGCADWDTTAPAACGGGGNTPPIILTAASATPNPVTQKSAVLSVSAGDDNGEPALTYGWTVTGNAGVTFSRNNANDAKSTTATFANPGTYQFTVNVTDADGSAASSMVSVQVVRSASTLHTAPVAVTLQPSTQQQFTASVVDQWNVLFPGAPVAWSTTGGGALAQDGVFTASAAEGGPFTVTATSGGVSSESFVTVSSAPPDKTDPTVFITSPTHGTDASGLMTLSANASDNVGVAKVLFFVDDVRIGDDSTRPYTTSWNADEATRGAHTLRARAVDFSGNVADAEIVVNVPGGIVAQQPDAGSAGGGGGGGGGAGGTGNDVTAPFVSISAPVQNANVIGTILIEATVSDDSGAASVVFQVDGVTVGTVPSAPYAIQFDTTTVSNGAHTLTAVATDRSGNSATSSPVVFNVGTGCGCTGVGGFAPVLFAAVVVLVRRRKAR